MTRHDSLAGCLIGTAVADALGLPYEGLSPARASRILGTPDRHRLCFRRGMVSDDTEHSRMVIQALLVSGREPAQFQRSLSWRLRWWLLGLPAGIGFATLRAIIRLWLGFGTARSGVYSAGNGPAMRSAVIGAAVEKFDLLKQLVRASARLTHTDPRAEQGAQIVALAAHLMSHGGDPAAFESLISRELDDESGEWAAVLEALYRSVASGENTRQYASSLDLENGVTGYVMHTVPVAIHAWLSHPTDYRAAVMAVIECGGDTDTVAAITGGIVGAAVGVQGIPQQWRKHMIEWPASLNYLQRLSACLATRIEADRIDCKPRLHVWALLPRNLMFLCIILVHGLRRLLPPY